MRSRRLTTAWLGTFVTNVAIKLGAVVTGVVVARLLLPEGRGALAAVLFWSAVVARIGLWSLKEATTYAVARQERGNTSVQASAALLSLGLVVPSAAIAYFLLPLLLGPERTDLVPLARTYALVFLPLNFVGLTLVGVDQGELRFLRYNVLHGALPAVYLAGILLLWALGLVSVERVVMANLVANGVFLVVRLTIAVPALRGGRPSWRVIKQLLGLGWRFHGAAVLLILATQADRLLVLSIWDNETVGLYMVAFTFASAGLLIVTDTFHTVLFPSIARQQDPERQRALLAKALRQALVLLAAIGVPLMISAKWVVPLVFGPKFAPAGWPAVVLVAAYVPMGLRQVLIRCLRGLGIGRPGTIAEAIALAFFAALGWPLASALGLVGVGLALGFGNVVAMAYLTWYLARHMAMPPGEWGRIGPATLRETWSTMKSLLRARAASAKAPAEPERGRADS